MGAPQLGEGGPYVRGCDGVAPEVTEAGGRPLQLLATLRQEPRPVGNLRQEGRRRRGVARGAGRAVLRRNVRRRHCWRARE